MKLCGARGFAGPSACIRPLNHEGEHHYGDFAAACAAESKKSMAEVYEAGYIAGAAMTRKLLRLQLGLSTEEDRK